MFKSYDKKERFDAEIKPLVEQIKAKCNLFRIPFLFVAAAANDKDDTCYRMTILTPASFGLTLTKDHVRGIVNVMNGFLTIPPESGVQKAVEEAASETGTILFVDDGSIVTGDDGEVFLDESAIHAPSDESVRQAVPVIDLSNVVAREPQQTAKTKTKKKKAEDDDFLVFKQDDEAVYGGLSELPLRPGSEKKNRKVKKGGKDG